MTNNQRITCLNSHIKRSPSIRHRIHPLVFVIAFLIAHANAFAAGKIKLNTQPPDVIIDQFKQLSWQPETNYFQSNSPVRVILIDPDTGEKTIILADNVEGSASKTITVKGHLTLTRPEGDLVGEDMTFNPMDHTGIIHNAKTDAYNIFLKGKVIQLLPGNILLAKDATFTTCRLKHPDYHITAKEVRVYPNGKVVGKGITFWLGPSRIISLPSLEKTFGPGVQNPIPIPGYSKQNGLALPLAGDVFMDTNRSMFYNIAIAAKQSPQGIISFAQDIAHVPPGAYPPSGQAYRASQPLGSALQPLPMMNINAPSSTLFLHRTTLYGLITKGTFVDNRERTDIQVDRLPDIGVHFGNILNSRQMNPNDPNFSEETHSVFGTSFLNPAEWIVSADINGGYFRELPDHVTSGRFSEGLNISSPLYVLANPFYIRYGMTLHSSYYTKTHTNYTLFSPEAEMDWVVRPNTLLSASYRLQQDFGKTPFLFDHKDVPHEVDFNYGCLAAHWGYNFGVRYDVQRWRAFDTILGIKKRFDCMEVGLAYHTRYEGLDVIFNLLPTGTKSTSSNQ
jgi:hypothetical protein